jgi:CubicO group peptidase (beta-lactamase class C family)
MLSKRDFLLTSAGAIAASGLPKYGKKVMAQSVSDFSAVRDLIAAQMDKKGLPGAVWLFSQGDFVFVDVAGATTMGGVIPMGRDTIFRIASMTKALTATAVMILIEEGKLALDSSAERWLPEIANRRVLRRIDGPLDDTVAAHRAITVRDLLAFTLGFGLLFDDALPIQRQIDRMKLVNGPPVPMTPHAPDEWMRLFGTLPLMHQPGEGWMYNTGSLLQGVLIARASGRRFDAFLRERIIEPLGMRDTDFFVPKEKLDRFAGCGNYTDEKGAVTRMDRDGAQSAYATPPAFPSGAAGLVSTVDDYLAFARMLLKGGVHNGRRILSAQSVHEMTRDQLTPEQKAAAQFFPHYFDTHGWGYGVGITTAPDDVSKTPGRYGWMGGFGTAWINDPNRDLIAMVMTQSTDFLFSGPLDNFWRLLYAAIK